MKSITKPILTMRDVDEALDEHDEVPLRKRREIKSAIRSIFREIGRSPSEFRADPADLRRIVESVSWQSTGVSKASWQNSLSLLRAGLRIVGIDVKREHHRHLTTLAWSAALAALPKSKGKALTTLAGWASAMAIEPDMVDEAVFARYCTYLEETSLRKGVRRSILATRWALNAWLRAAHSNRPEIPLRGPRRFQSRPWEAFPPSFRDDIDAWKEWAAAGHDEDDFDDDDREDRPALRPATIKNYLNALRRAASRLADDGIPIERFVGLHTLVEDDCVRRLRRLLRQNVAEEKADPAVVQTFSALLSGARWVEEVHPDVMVAAVNAGIARAHKAVGKAANRRGGMADKHKLVLAALRNPRLGARYRNLAARVMIHFPVGKPLSVANASVIQMLVLHEVLQETGIRIGNAAALDLDRHIVRPFVGKDVPWLVFIPLKETKTGKPINLELSMATTALLDDYLVRARPLLQKFPSPAVFLTMNGLRKTAKELSTQYGNFTEYEIGIRITPHFHRHYCATTIVNEGGDLLTASKLLTHASPQTTASFYAHLERDVAQTRWHDILERLRADDRETLEILLPDRFRTRGAA